MALGPLSQPGASARLPDAPTSISASAVSGGQATVSFVASTNPGKGSGNYVVTSSPSSFTANGASSPITVTGLATGTAYTFTVVKQSGSGISSATSGASGSITAFVPPTFGAQTGTSTADAVSATTGISNVYTTSGTLSKSISGGATFYDYQRISGTAVTPSGDSLTSLAENTSHEWRARVYNTSSSQSLVTKVTPNGSSSSVAVVYGDTLAYGNTATVSGGLASIGSGLTEQTTTWNLGSSTKGNPDSIYPAKTIYYKITVTYAGGAIVEQTGEIERSIPVTNGTSTGAFVTYTSRSAISNAIGFSLSRPSYGANIEVSQVTLVGGGGGGGDIAFNGAGGGGGGRAISVGAFSFSDSIGITVGGGGIFRGDGSATLLSRTAGNVSAGGGKKGTDVGAGGNSGDNINPGAAGGNGIYGGGGGGTGGGATNQDGGPGGTFGVGPGGPGAGDTGFGYAFGNYASGSSSASYGAGGQGLNGTGANGAWSIDWVGPVQA